MTATSISPAARLAANAFLQFVNSTGSPYHSVLAARSMLDSAGFHRLDDRTGWSALVPGGKYYVTRNHSTIMAFVIGNNFAVGKGGFIIAASHTDSPCLKVRPNSDVTSESFKLLGVETYGGERFVGLWHTWLDRGLGLAGKVVVQTGNQQLEERLVRVARPLMVIPNLAIHLKTQSERGMLELNTETHLRPVMCSVVKQSVTTPAEEFSGASFEPIKSFLASELDCKPEALIDVDICLMDATNARLMGLYEEFIESPRIDNLASTWAGVKALCELTDDMILSSTEICVSISFNYEEVGSVAPAGAESVVFESWLRKIVDSLAKNVGVASFSGIIEKSFLLSTDGAHGVHPNYADRSQAQHKPLLHGGVVVKENCNLRYASDVATMALVRMVAQHCQPVCPLQNFVVRNGTPCGSTIGPMTAARLGVRGADVGIAQWAMHSIRETCSVEDLNYLKNLILAFFSRFRSIDADMQVL